MLFVFFSLQIIFLQIEAREGVHTLIVIYLLCDRRTNAKKKTPQKTLIKIIINTEVTFLGMIWKSNEIRVLFTCCVYTVTFQVVKFILSIRKIEFAMNYLLLFVRWSLLIICMTHDIPQLDNIKHIYSAGMRDSKFGHSFALTFHSNNELWLMC